MRKAKRKIAAVVENSKVQGVPHPDIGLQQLWYVLHDAHIKNVDRGGLGSAPLEEVILVPEEVVQGLQLLQNKKINF